MENCEYNLQARRNGPPVQALEAVQERRQQYANIRGPHHVHRYDNQSRYENQDRQEKRRDNQERGGYRPHNRQVNYRREGYRLDNCTDWARKLHSALWAYRTSYKRSIWSTPFRMAFGVEAVMPTELLVPSLRIQVEHRRNEKKSEQARGEGLLRLEEEWLSSLKMVDYEQQIRKDFVDRHQRFDEEMFQEGKPVLVF